MTAFEGTNGTFDRERILPVDETKRSVSSTAPYRNFALRSTLILQDALVSSTVIVKVVFS
jgi:hypothetical protein